MLVKQDQNRKLTPKFNPVGYRVEKVRGSMIIAKNEFHEITRNCSFFKSLKEKLNNLGTS